MDKVTVAQAFEVAIATEKAAERLFQGLEAKFAHHKERMVDAHTISVFKLEAIIAPHQLKTEMPA